MDIPPYLNYMETITVKQMIAFLKTCDPNYNVVLSVDKEGNGYGSIDKIWSFMIINDTKTIIIYPDVEGLDEDEVWGEESIADTLKSVEDKLKRVETQ